MSHLRWSNVVAQSCQTLVLADPEAIRRAKDEQSELVWLLKETGERESNLPLHWLSTDENTETDTNEGEGSPGGGGSTVVGGALRCIAYTEQRENHVSMILYGASYSTYTVL